MSESDEDENDALLGRREEGPKDTSKHFASRAVCLTCPSGLRGRAKELQADKERLLRTGGLAGAMVGGAEDGADKFANFAKLM